MSASVVITGLGPISSLGVGIEPTWLAACNGTVGFAPVEAFDASRFDCTIAAEVRDFKAAKIVPKTYRKAVKVMARDIELAVGAADAAARDAGLVTKGIATADDKNAEFTPTYPSNRMAAQIGAALIASEIDELTSALAKSVNDDGSFSYEKFGTDGIANITPLWLLKYLPNMLACHVTIIHDTRGPSNTITCNEASSHLSVGESLRIIQRGSADAAFCGGAESKLNPMGFFRCLLTGRINCHDNDNPQHAARPFCKTAAGSITGEGGGIVILESETTAKARGARAYARARGFGATQSVNIAKRNLEPDPEGRGIANAIRIALRDADCSADDIDMIVAFGLAVPAYDNAEAAAFRTIFGDRLSSLPIYSPKALVGSLGAGDGGIDLCIAAKALAEQTIPAIVSCAQPLEGLGGAATAPARKAELRNVLSISTSFGGQNAAIVLGRTDD